MKRKLKKDKQNKGADIDYGTPMIFQTSNQDVKKSISFTMLESIFYSTKNHISWEVAVKDRDYLDSINANKKELIKFLLTDIGIDVNYSEALNYFYGNKFVFQEKKGDALNNAIEEAIKDSKNCDEECNIIERISNRIVNKDDFLQYAINNLKFSSNIRYTIRRIIRDDIIDDDHALLTAPYMLNRKEISHTTRNYMFFMHRVKNLDVIKLHVLKSKEKEIIAFYIFKNKDIDLMIKLFGSADAYLEYCIESFNESTIKEIKEFIKNDIKFKYVDDKIEELLNSCNEQLDSIKIIK